MKSLSLVLLSLIATQAYANLLDGLEHHGHGDHGHGDHGHGEHGDHAHGDHGDHGHGDHGEHGDHGDHAEHGHGDHGEHGDHGDHGEHGDHGDHGHGNHGEHGDHGDNGHHDHAEGDHQHNAQNTVNNDAFANALAADLGGGFLSANPAPSNDLGSQPNNDLTQGFLQSNPAPTQAAPQSASQQDPTFNNQGKQLLGNGELGGPSYAAVPQTSFRCEDQATGGYFADTEAECQVFHICLNGDNLGSFLCPNGTLFHQQFFVCDWWFNVDCNVAPDSYSLNANIGVVPEVK